MADAFATTKTLASGSEKMVIVDAHNYFQRLSNLPTDWKEIRMGVIISFTTLASDNAAVSAESYAISSGVSGELVFGLTNGSGLPGQAGNKCLLWAGESDGTDAIQLSGDGTNYRLKQKFRTFTRGNGTTLSRVSGGANNPELKFGLPQNTTQFCLGLTMRLNVATAGSLSGTHGSLTLQSATDMPALMSLLFAPANTTTPTTQTGGWWDNTGSNPVGLQYLYIHHPFINHRLRVHNWGVIRTA